MTLDWIASEDCGCCEINDYAEPEDENETACVNCGHSPEEHGL